MSNAGVLMEQSERIDRLQSLIEKQAMTILTMTAEISDHYREQSKILSLERALRMHHTGIGCINYCRTCGGYFSWEDPSLPVSFTPSGGAAGG